MSYFPHGAAVAAHQARERRKRDEEEELLMTKYTPAELDGNWEFKIVRSETGAFRKPEVFQMLLQEEAIAGWELVEKLDDRRVRFKRRTEARRKDITLPPGVDPYRSTYGNAGGRFAISISIAILLAGMVAATIFSESQELATAMPVLTIGIVFTAVIAALIQRRR